MSFKDAIQKAVEDYNKYRSPEARVSLVEIRNNQLTIDFEGSFCWGCGVSDYFEDFIYELKRYSKARITVSSFEQSQKNSE